MMRWLTAALLLLIRVVCSLELDPDSRESVGDVTALVADGMMDYYAGYKYGGTIGVFVEPVYWWEGGAAWGAMIDNWRLTGNTTYEATVKQALEWQKGEDNDFLPKNFSLSQGNDDQGFWALAGLSAVESGFPEPDSDDYSWLGLVQAVFNEYVMRWDNETCNGGLRWQIFTFNNGYDYKNTVSNGCFFQVAARLARYTGNATYAEWAAKVYDWTIDVGFISSENYTAWDGAMITNDCSSIDRTQWTYNLGLYLGGCAYMYNYTNGSQTWLTRTEGFFQRAQNVFYYNDIVYEPACEPYDSCNTNSLSFKGYLSRFMGYTWYLVPSLRDQIMPMLRTTAEAAALACSGGSDGHTCGNRWTWDNGTWSGDWSMSIQLAALESTQVVLYNETSKLLTSSTGGNSTSYPDAGSEDSSTDSVAAPTSSDKGWAGFLTAVASLATIGFTVWMLM